MQEIPRKLADFAERELRGRGIEIRTNTTLERVTAHHAYLSDGEQVPTRTLVWTAGVKPQPVVASLGLPLTDRGRIVSDAFLQVPGFRQRVGDRRLRRGARPGAQGRAVPADGAARDPPGPRRRAQRRGGARRRAGASAAFATRRRACSSTWAAARRSR